VSREPVGPDGSPAPGSKPVRKRLFVGAAAACLTLLALASLLLWLTVFRRPEVLCRVVTYLMAAVGLLLPLLGLGLSVVVFVLAVGRPLVGLRRFARASLSALFPLAVLVARLFRLDRHQVENSFIQINNAFVEAEASPVKGSKLLLLLPHCLQRRECRHKITVDTRNCRRCGGCPIGGLLDLADRLDLRVCVASGGSQARSAVREGRPRAIVAVGCERELVSGIQDVGPLPVLGIVNLRPNGPCRDTEVDLSLVSQGVTQFLLERGT